MNHFPLWKNLLIISVLAWGMLYAAPNLFGQSPAIQISAARSEAVDTALLGRVETALKARQLPIRAIELQSQRLLVRFADAETQLKAADAIRVLLGRDYTVALNLASELPQWLQRLGFSPMYLGLDLRGGVHFLMEVDTQAVLTQAQNALVEDFKVVLREQNLRYGLARRLTDGRVEVQFRRAEDRDAADTLLRDRYPRLTVDTADNSLFFTFADDEIAERERDALQQNITTLRNRINELGVAEPTIQQQGSSRIVVQLPGVQDTARAKDILGATATLAFHLVAEGDAQAAAASGRAPVNTRLYRDRQGLPYLLNRQVIITGDRITSAASGIAQDNGQPAVFIGLDSQGARRMENATKDNIGKPMAVVFIETKSEPKDVNGEIQFVPFTTEEIINVATIRDRLSSRFQITGLDSTEEARDLALLLRAGALAAPLNIIEERTIGPSAGRDNIAQGFNAALIALVLVMMCVAYYYRRFGLIANVALMANLVLIIAMLSVLQATLTLPGIAGIILTMGMAVDANVLIFERIREELTAGNTPQLAIQAGFERAFDTVWDANITTLIAAVLLFGFGSGPIKGFAVTLCIGILTTMFAGILVSRALVNANYGTRAIKNPPPKTLPL